MLLGNVIQKLSGYHIELGVLSRDFRYNHLVLGRYTETFRIIHS